LANWAYDVDYDVKISLNAKECLRNISDKVVLTNIKEEIKSLSGSPQIKGKALGRKLKGYRRLRLSRYRIIYKVIESKALVVIASVGIEKEGDREDVYKMFESFLETANCAWYLKPEYF